ncbi:uncharacterized protein YoxC [Paenibacillus anaericanus]|uniref:YvrJ family protein n=1 Tax=Paenibacillus anaericanus TaxID=170367 RepID=A0A433Y7F5_9BACL|nr:hypothetical protein [Paenibacillus anaericanus]MDQ0091940.1 uncharacterized protein YoxC [Paenibacillus anaericanus]RUT45290.1 hypothetical protein EJP82_15085 [Paenibacillus anaericanus]
MQVTDMISLVTNVGFPVTLCFILIKYVLQTVGTKLDKLESSMHTLTEEIKILEDNSDEIRDVARANPKSK